MNKLTLSIVIPAYNEEDHLADCLTSIVRQTERPDEVIVINNNSTDQTAAIARRFSFVTLIDEPKQGLIAARNAGFAAAHGDLLGRTNADVMLDPDWVAHAKRHFYDEPELAALAGLGRTVLLPHDDSPRFQLWSRIYAVMSEAYFAVPILWGANMIVHRTAWHQIARQTSLDDKAVHEDQDISLCLAANGLLVQRDNRLYMTTGEQSYFTFPKLCDYLQRAWATKRLHRQNGSYYRSRGQHYVWWQRLWRAAATCLPAIAFIVASPLVYYVGQYYQRLGAERI